MGSRITRAVYREERTATIPRRQKHSVRTLISYFIIFILAFCAFLYGYLLGPHHAHLSPLTGLLPLCLLPFFPHYLVRVSLATPALLLLATITPPLFFQGIGVFHIIAPPLITASVGLSAVLCLKTLGKSFLQGQMLWLQV